MADENSIFLGHRSIRIFIQEAISCTVQFQETSNADHRLAIMTNTIILLLKHNTKNSKTAVKIVLKDLFSVSHCNSAE